MAKMMEYGFLCETKADRRGMSALYSGDGANYFYFAMCDWADPLNGAGKTGAALRRAHLANVDASTRDEYLETRTIGTPWIVVRIATSRLFDLPQKQFDAFFTESGQMKLKPAAVAILKSLVQAGKAVIIHRGADYVHDLYTAWTAEGKNFGYAVEVYLFGKSNRSITDRVDGDNVQCKACFTLYRTENRPNSAGKPDYQAGTQCGISTANGVR